MKISPIQPRGQLSVSLRRQSGSQRVIAFSASTMRSLKLAYTHVAIDHTPKRLEFTFLLQATYKGTFAFPLIAEGGKKTVGRVIACRASVLDEFNVPIGVFHATVRGAVVTLLLRRKP